MTTGRRFQASEPEFEGRFEPASPGRRPRPWLPTRIRSLLRAGGPAALCNQRGQDDESWRYGGRRNGGGVMVMEKLIILIYPDELAEHK